MKKKYLKRTEQWKKIESKLEVGDIILSHDRKSWLARTIHRTTGSYWNHISIVMAVPDEESGFDNVILVEAMPRGIELRRIQRFTKHLNRYDLGVKRFPGLTDEIRERVLAYMMNNVDVPYDFTRLFGYILNKLLGGLLWPYKEKFIDKDDFICSSFTQKAFYHAMPESRKKSVLFRKDIDFPQALEEISPSNIAKSTACKWIYNKHY